MSFFGALTTLDILTIKLKKPKKYLIYTFFMCIAHVREQETQLRLLELKAVISCSPSFPSLRKHVTVFIFHQSLRAYKDGGCRE